MPLRAVLFDAGNTLLFLDYARMAAAVGGALGLPLTGAGLAAGAAPAAARRWSGRGRPTASAPRPTSRRCSSRPACPPARLEEVRDCLARLHGERHLWSGIAGDTHDALARLRGAGLRLGVVSNSDGRVEEALEAAGLRDYFDVVVDSALAGVEKPDPAIFRAALEALGVAAGRGALRRRPVRGGRARRAAPRAFRRCCSSPPGAPRPARLRAPSARSRALADDLLKERLAS